MLGVRSEEELRFFFTPYSASLQVKQLRSLAARAVRVRSEEELRFFFTPYSASLQVKQ
jgi:hypothetical protein